MHKFIRQMAGVSILFCFLGNPANAMPIRYDEAVDGDLISGIGDRPLIELGIGANKFSGTFSANNPEAEDPGPGADFDSVLFRIVEGTALRKIQISIPFSSGILETAYVLNQVYLELPGVPTFFIGDSGNISVPTDGFLSLTLGFGNFLGPGDYHLVHGYIQYVGGNDVRFADYTIKFIVSSVPEPTSLALLSLGLVGMSARRRKNTCGKIVGSP